GRGHLGRLSVARGGAGGSAALQGQSVVRDRRPPERPQLSGAGRHGRDPAGRAPPRRAGATPGPAHRRGAERGARPQRRRDRPPARPGDRRTGMTAARGGGTGGLNRTILAIALPSMLTNVATALFGLADTWIIGRLGDPVAQGAVEVGAKFLMTLLIVFNFLRS